MSIPRSPIVSEFETEEQAASYDRCHTDSSTVACLVLGKWLFIQTTWWSIG